MVGRHADGSQRCQTLQLRRQLMFEWRTLTSTDTTLVEIPAINMQTAQSLMANDIQFILICVEINHNKH